MWYDRETQQVINPHFNGAVMFFLDDETIIYRGIDHTWIYDVDSMKKKRFFNNKSRNKIIDMVGTFSIFLKSISPNTPLNGHI